MEGNYEVSYGGQKAGKVQIFRQGLYYRIVCRCCVPEDGVFRLYAVSGAHRESIGVVVPEGDGFFLEKKVPVKRLSGEEVHFLLSSGEETARGCFVPIVPDEPFGYIERLKTSFLQSEHGKIGIRIEKSPEAV